MILEVQACYCKRYSGGILAVYSLQLSALRNLSVNPTATFQTARQLKYFPSYSPHLRFPRAGRQRRRATRFALLTLYYYPGCSTTWMSIRSLRIRLRAVRCFSTCSIYSFTSASLYMLNCSRYLDTYQCGATAVASSRGRLCKQTCLTVLRSRFNDFKRLTVCSLVTSAPLHRSSPTSRPNMMFEWLPVSLSKTPFRPVNTSDFARSKQDGCNRSIQK